MNSASKSIVWVLLLVILLISGISMVGSSHWISARANTNAITKVPESKDFATQVLGNPWDMDEFSDISQYLNRSGQAEYLRNIAVSGSIFSATGNRFLNPDDGKWGVDPQFFPLYPGYVIGIPAGKIGNNYPIKSAEYRCLYIAMNVASKTTDNDHFQVMWFEDEHLNGGKWGFTTAQWLNPDVGIWKLHKVDLEASNWSQSYTTHWLGNATWQGIRIDPTQKEVNFQVDWVRLTNCAPVNLPAPITWSSTNARIWIRPQGTTREIHLASNVSNSYNPDLAGVAPGVYDILVRRSDDGGLIQTVPVEINKAYIAEFKRPSFITGKDYAQTAGNSWDFAASPDVKSTSCITTSSYDPAGYYRFVTRQGNVQPSGCWTTDPMGLATDSKLYLNLPGPLLPAEYRYFSYRLKTESPIQNIPEGMIVRLIWSTDSYTRPNQGYRCHMVSQLIAYDVGWHTYSIDLFDAFNGSVVQTAGDCPAASTLSWKTSKPILELRLDPNENIALGDMAQYLDHIWLTKPDEVKKGTDYLIEVRFNRPVSQITSMLITLVNAAAAPPLEESQGSSALSLPERLAAAGIPAYTRQVDLSAYAGAREDSASLSAVEVIEELGVGNSIFLPSALNSWLFPVDEYTHLESWPTGNMAAGDYRVCFTVDDDYNLVEWCSEAFVRVTP